MVDDDDDDDDDGDGDDDDDDDEMNCHWRKLEHPEETENV